MFQFTRPGGRDSSSLCLIGLFGRFNSRARVGATYRQCQRHARHQFQFTRPGGRDFINRLLTTLLTFQFTRPGGRDSVPNAATCGSSVSIHAPGWARLAGLAKSRATANCFNSRARVGATVVGSQTQGRERVSIHAPGWARQPADSPLYYHRAFQFTRPGGRDSFWRRFCPVIRGFNSRARVGATYMYIYYM